MKSRKWVLAGLIALSVSLVQGCGSQKKGEHPVYPVSGQVLYKGKPLPDAFVMLVPETKNLPGAYAKTDQDGRFQTTTYNPKDGAVAGNFKVVVQKSIVPTTEEISDPKVGAKIKIASAIPLKYSNPNLSKLSANVTQQGPNDLTISLN